MWEILYPQCAKNCLVPEIILCFLNIPEKYLRELVLKQIAAPTHASLADAATSLYVGLLG